MHRHDPLISLLEERRPAIIRIPSNTCKPEKVTEAYHDTILDDIGKKVNLAKKKLDDAKKDRDDPWFTLSKLDHYSLLKATLTERYDAQHVSNAWLKMYELLVTFPQIANNCDKVFFFNAELPGSFIYATYMYLAARYGLKKSSFQWYGASYMEYGEGSTVLEDRYGLYRDNKDHWLSKMKEDYKEGSYNNNGDATKVSNIEDYAKHISADVATADAGIDSSSNYFTQEDDTLAIHLGCACAAFKTLKKGGSFVTKQFTFCSTLSWNLILLYSNMFDEFYIYKPVTSRATNSEIYLVGLGFRGFIYEKELLAKLAKFDMLPIISLATVHEHGAQSLAAVQSAAQIIFMKQVSLLDDVLSLHKSKKMMHADVRKLIDATKKSICEKWIKQMEIKKMKKQNWL